MGGRLVHFLAFFVSFSCVDTIMELAPVRSKVQRNC